MNYDGLTDIERIARHRITERTRPTKAEPRLARRTRLASTLRRAADRLEG